MNWRIKAIELSTDNLYKLYDEDKGGFYYSIDKNGKINKNKLLRYNARVMELLNPNYFDLILKPTAEYVVNSMIFRFGEKVFHSTRDPKDAGIGDISLLITALNKFKCYEKHTKMLLKSVKIKLAEGYLLNADQVPWMLYVLRDESLEHHFINVRKMKNKLFFFSHIGFPTLIYMVHYLIEVNKIEMAVDIFKTLKNKFLTKEGEWKLAYFPFFNFVYRKAFSVHQLGMAPLYLLELYEKVQDEEILSVVERSLKFGKRFVSKDMVYRSSFLKETRSYECAFHYAGLMKAKEYLEA